MIHFSVRAMRVPGFLLCLTSGKLSYYGLQAHYGRSYSNPSGQLPEKLHLNFQSASNAQNIHESTYKVPPVFLFVKVLPIFQLPDHGRVLLLSQENSFHK